MSEIQVNGHLTYIGVKEDNAKIRIWHGLINESDSMIYALIFRYTIIPAEDKFSVRRIHMVFVNDLDGAIDREKQLNILKQYMFAQAKIYDDPQYLHDVRDKLMDDLPGYLGLSIDVNIYNYFKPDNNVILSEVPSMIVELQPNKAGFNFNIIKHTKLKTIGSREIDRFYNTDNLLFCFMPRNTIALKNAVLHKASTEISDNDSDKVLYECNVAALRNTEKICEILITILFWKSKSDKAPLAIIILLRIDSDKLECNVKQIDTIFCTKYDSDNKEQYIKAFKNTINEIIQTNTDKSCEEFVKSCHDIDLESLPVKLNEFLGIKTPDLFDIIINHPGNYRPGYYNGIYFGIIGGKIHVNKDNKSILRLNRTNASSANLHEK